jgi:hypothetical protein
MAKKKVASKKPKVCELTISLPETSPLVWRKVLVHEFIELYELHMLIQISMGWENRHLYSFKINEKSYSDGESAAELKNTFEAEGTLLSDALGGSKKFTYVYDFGDNWVHEVEITNTLEHDPRMQYPVCIGGGNACPPEDCGGLPGFDDLKSIIAGPDSEDKDEMLSWLGGFYDPMTFDPNFVNRFLLWAE